MLPPMNMSMLPTGSYAEPLS